MTNTAQEQEGVEDAIRHLKDVSSTLDDETFKAINAVVRETRRLRARQREGDGSCRICNRPTEGVTLCRYCDRMMEHLEGEREPETSQFLRDTLPRNWNYRIHVRGVGGVTVRAWDYEVPETEEYVAAVAQVDPRETRDDRDLLAQIRLGLERIATKRALDTEPPAATEEDDG